MSSRLGYALAVLLLLIAAALRFSALTTLPVGFHADEITDVRVTETVRQGSIEVFYDVGNEGREGLYHAFTAAVTSFIGSGQFSYRIVSVWVSLLTLALVFALAWRLYGPLAGVAALALLAVNMEAILLGRGVYREAVVPLLVTGVMLTMARALAVYQSVHPRLPVNTAFIGLGVLLGVGFYIHPAHFMIALLAMVFIVYRLASRQPLPQQTFSYLLFSLLLMMIIATPYLISSLRLPGLSGATRVFGDYRTVDTPPIQALLNGISGVLFTGDANPVLNLPGRPLIDLVSGLLVLIGGLAAISRWRQARYGLLLIAVVVLIPVAFLVSGGPNFLALTPLLPPLALFFGLGVNTLYRSFFPGRRWIVAFGLLALLGFNLVWTVNDLFNRWPRLPEVYTAYNGRIGQIAHHLDDTADDVPTVICESDKHPPELGGLTNTELLLLTMNRKTAHLRYADCGISLILVNGGEPEQVVMPDPDSLDKVEPYLRGWLDRGERLNASDLPPDSVVRLSVVDALADTIGRFTTTAPAGFAPEATDSPALAVPPISFGGNITFLGYEQQPVESYPPGGIFTSITYWRVDGVVPPDLRLFTHILADPGASPAAQTDNIGVDVDQLRSRDVFVQVTFVPLPVSMPPGEYSVSIGAYLQSTGQRMAVLEGDRSRGTRLFLGQLRVAQMGG